VVYGLYEVSIFLVSRVEKKREQKLKEEGFYDDEGDFDDPILKEFDEDRKE
jgi:sec-independent protein translocase protein TatC